MQSPACSSEIRYSTPSSSGNAVRFTASTFMVENNASGRSILTWFCQRLKLINAWTHYKTDHNNDLWCRFIWYYLWCVVYTVYLHEISETFSYKVKRSTCHTVCACIYCWGEASVITMYRGKSTHLVWQFQKNSSIHSAMNGSMTLSSIVNR